jgi:hypothetical protein
MYITFNFSKMPAEYTYYKNSNTGEIVMKQSFHGYSFEVPDHFYDYQKKLIGEDCDLTGFVEISEKRFNREAKKQKKIMEGYNNFTFRTFYNKN